LNDIRPTFWQAVPCPACGKRSWAVPWEPQAVCCGKPLQVVEVYLPTNPGGSQFGRNAGAGKEKSGR